MGDYPTTRVLVKMPTINRPERLKLEGVLAYAHTRCGKAWSVELALDALPAGSQAATDGIIAYVAHPDERAQLIATGKPLVLIEDLLEPADYSRLAHVVTLYCDHAGEGRTAATYFLARHYRSFAFVGTRNATPWSDQRRDGFVGCLADQGHACAVYPSDGMAFADELPRLAAWLAALPRPCALFAVHDFRSRQVLAAARAAGLDVPEDLAILGVDDDEIVCTTTSPALSSIPTSDRELGYAAGRILNQLISGRVVGGRVLTTRHTRVTSRLSTDKDALADPYVARALTYARNHLDEDIDAATLARHVGYSKRMLQIRAERVLGMSLGEEIRRLRLDAALELLSDTDQPVGDVALSCGFTSTSHLALRVKEATGLTPLAYRRKNALS